MSNCVICGVKTKKRRTCSDECLRARQLQLKKHMYNVVRGQKEAYFEAHLDKELERREIQGVLNDV